jgi:hypothetical protein
MRRWREWFIALLISPIKLRKTVWKGVWELHESKLTQCGGDSKGWNRCGNQRRGQTRDWLSVLCLLCHESIHLSVPCTDGLTCFPEIQNPLRLLFYLYLNSTACTNLQVNTCYRKVQCTSTIDMLKNIIAMLHTEEKLQCTWVAVYFSWG